MRGENVKEDVQGTLFTQGAECLECAAMVAGWGRYERGIQDFG